MSLEIIVVIGLALWALLGRQDNPRSILTRLHGLPVVQSRSEWLVR